MLHPTPSLVRALATASLLCATPAFALTQAAGDQRAHARARAEAADQYSSAIAACGKLPVRDKDVCQVTAKAERTKREARAQALFKGTPQAAHQARLTIAQADLDASLRFCGQRSGSVSRACKLEARQQYERAKADADQAMRDGQPIDKALGDTSPIHPQDPRACDTLEGGAKHACLARAQGTASP